MTWTTRALRAAAPLALIGAPAACVHVKTDPVEIKPIHIVADVNVNVKVDRELDDVFFASDKRPAPATSAPATQPSASAVGAVNAGANQR